MKDLGTLHRNPPYVLKALRSSQAAFAAWNDITPLARNEWICWITSAVKEETRDRRLRIAIENLAQGKRRPCCFAGCPHRTT